MSGHLYHVTFYNRLGDITEDGLQPGRGRGIGGSVYDTHRQGAIFLTDPGGVYFWGSRAEDFARDASDDLYEDGLAPVLLRVPGEYENDCDVDEIGTSDARYDAFKCGIEIDPVDIEVWVGTVDEGRWAPVDEWNEIPYDSAFEEDREEDDDGEETVSMILRDAHGSPSPLIPDLDKFGDVEENPSSRMRIERGVHIGKVGPNPKRAVANYRAEPGNPEYAIIAAAHYARKDRKNKIVIPGNSYMRAVFHIGNEGDDLRKYQPGSSSSVGWIVEPSGDVYDAKFTAANENPVEMLARKLSNP